MNLAEKIQMQVNANQDTFVYDIFLEKLLRGQDFCIFS